ncbi:ATP-dependent RNA helicase DHX8 [Pseudolycoriella hygida]|uniref:ATP-dependent RNA helicase DHX8 n=1 Tax=Pseudolycoriella hygida TaxID=35572 RepID=A0A9Q0N141_9DIPT|nr:ATP-dependent RNA helicase DHX8 [Pseudolycoriella hygida]
MNRTLNSQSTLRVNSSRQDNHRNSAPKPEPSINRVAIVNERTIPSLPTAPPPPKRISEDRGENEEERNITSLPIASLDKITKVCATNASSFYDEFVINALNECDCNGVLQIFVDNEIDKAAFLLLNEDDIRELIPGKLGPRKKLWEFIQNHRKVANNNIDTTELAHEMREVNHDSVNSTISKAQHCDEYEEDSFEHLDGDNGTRSRPSTYNNFTLNMQFVNQTLDTFKQTFVQNYDSERKSNEIDFEKRAKDEVDEMSKSNKTTTVVQQSVEQKSVESKPLELKSIEPPKLEDSNNASVKPRKTLHKPRQSKPISYIENKRLPIHKYKNEFLKMVQTHKVVIVVAETGSGKSTQMPQYLARDNYAGKIHVAFEYGTKLGEGVGYRVRFDNCTENTTKISYVTEAVLVHELATDVNASNYSVIIVDEAHERNINTDVLFGCLKKAIALRPDLKVVISSATMETAKFSNFFNGAPILNIPGRLYPVKVLYERPQDLPNPDYLNAVMNRICCIHRASIPGDILAFLPGQEDIELATDQITQLLKDRPNKFLHFMVLPLYSKLPLEQQHLIFEAAPPHTRKVCDLHNLTSPYISRTDQSLIRLIQIVLATNIAETSLTIDGIVFVVDSGLVKQSEYITKANGATLECMTLLTVQITKSQAKQRSGRAGRTQAGIAYRVYSEATYEKMDESPRPEILRGNLEMVVLLLFSMGVKNILDFDFIDSPPRGALLTAFERLEELGALKKEMLSAEYTLTSMGKQMASFPIEPYLSKMLIISADLGCTEEMLTIIALLSGQVDKLFKRPKKKRMEADAKKKTFEKAEGDHITLLNVYNEWLRQSHQRSRAWCHECYLDWRTLEEAYEVRFQLSMMLDEKNFVRKSCGTDMTKVQRAIVSGSFRKIAWKPHSIGYAYYTYSNPVNEPVLIHPSSGLFSKSPKLVIYNNIIKTKKAYMNQVLEIEIEYIKEYASDFYIKLLCVMPR